VLYNRYFNTGEFIRIMNIVKCAGYIVTEDSNIHLNGDDYIHIDYDDKTYVFNRYDQFFINKVEEAIESNPYKHMPGASYEGHLTIEHVDDRFTRKKYYSIEKHGPHHEELIIHHELIVEDLYYIISRVREHVCSTYDDSDLDFN